MKIYSKREIDFIYVSNKADFIQTLGRLRLLNVNPLLFKVLLKFYHQKNKYILYSLLIFSSQETSYLFITTSNPNRLPK